MSLITDILKLLRRSDPPPSTLKKFDVPATMMNYFALTGNKNRTSIARACSEFYLADSRVSAVVDTLARDTVKGGFRLTSKNKKAEDLANAVVNRLDITDQLEDWLKVVFNQGDLFLNIGVADNEVVGLQRLPSLEVKRLSDRIDRFQSRTKAFSWDISTNDTVYFQDWEMVHGRWNRFDFDQYGRPLLASGLNLWNKVIEGELDMATARKTRAGLVRTHVLEDATPQEVETYKEANRAAMESAAAIVNLFSNRKTSFTQHEGAGNLPDIADVQHFIEGWWASAPVPMALIAYGQNLSRDVITLKEKQYRRAIEQITTWIDKQIIIPIVEVEWLLHGILPEDVDFETAWKSKDPLTSADLRDIADSVLRFKAVGVSDELIATFISRFIPGIDVNSLVEQLAKADAQDTTGISNDGSNNNFDATRVGSTAKKFGVALNRK